DLRPIAFVMENVPEIGRFGGANVAENIAEAAGDLGYETRYSLLNAVWYGVPQFRERMIIVGIRPELNALPGLPKQAFDWPLPSGYATSRAGNGWTPVMTPRKHFVDHVARSDDVQKARTVRDAFAGLPKIEEHLQSSPDRSLIRDPERLATYSK